MTTVQPIVITPDVSRLLVFYQQLLGAVQVRQFPADGPVFFVELRLGDSTLGLVSEADADLSASPRILLSVAVPDVDALLDRVAPLGGQVLGPPNDMPWGQRVVHLRDPDGNPVNLTQNLTDADGSA
ncbi:VOC family protein [Plantactinospora endophytica]|uniref:Extradiol dioxygenase n=1 Tax=Plantactinospora endophytica TaxID=673535 RepID=A0ABQ4E1Q3_9ACTN|nr:VOC family protein [Plantactinospora endophytica]GIG88628.1 extradiol dioxygenase [Plantactinospora endophytica]